MANLKKIGMVAGTFSVALGIGFIMQNGDALASRFGTEGAPEQPAPFTQTESVDTSAVSQPDLVDPSSEQAIATAQAGVAFSKAPTVADPVVTAADAAVTLPETAKVPDQQDAPLQLATLDADIVPDIDPDRIASAQVECVPVMTATADQAATVDLNILAPCHTSEPFTIHHQGMLFTMMTDEAGNADLNLPALAEVAVVIAAFENGDGAVDTVVVPDFKNYDRAVLQWQGQRSVLLSAYEGDAEFGDAGHIYPENPGNMARLVAGEGGYLVSLGDASVQDPLMAEVYTFPTGKLGESFDVFLVAEAEITTLNCGQELAAQSIQVFPSGQASALDLTMVMPECDAVGDFLILQNMFEDLTIASK